MRRPISKLVSTCSVLIVLATAQLGSTILTEASLSQALRVSDAQGWADICSAQGARATPADPSPSQLHTLEQRLAKMDIGLKITDAALAKLAEAGFDPVYGARPLKRAIQQEVENPLSKAILEGRFGPKDTIEIDLDGAELAFRKSV